MVLEVVTVAVVKAREVNVFGRGEPPAGFAVDENAADALPVVLAGLQEGLDLRNGGRARSADLHPVDHAGNDGIGEFERILGVLRQRPGEIGHIDFGIAQLDLARFLLAPSAQRQNGDAGQRHESRRPQREASSFSRKVPPRA
ncbi:hypothetical protein [Bradyrhizobium vignae]|uniref:hypothetical protein n=1 Tax=Bradyrhizobium vignae TaxID=1549949 RepID=UPI0028A15DE8|nr:hypothetical protein [Bradyrhizobium vignae]